MSDSGSEKRKGRVSQVRQRQKRFLEHLALNGNVSEAARVADVKRGTLYHWKSSDEVFSKQWDYALEDAVDVLEAEARRRAMTGYDEPVIYGGKIIRNPETGQPLIKKRYSDGLMTFLLKAHCPSRFQKEGRRSDERSIAISITQDDDTL